MPRNTKILVGILTVLASVVAGINVVRWISPQDDNVLSVNTKQSHIPTTTLTPTPSHTSFTTNECGISLKYPSDYSISEDASGSAILSEPDGTNAVVVSCQKGLPKPTGPNTTVETIDIAGIAAKKYHLSLDSGESMDTVVMRHPKTKLDIFIAGYGQEFEEILQSITVIR